MFDQTSLLKHEVRKYESDYGHGRHEWGYDDSEQLEWEQHYGARRGKWRDENNDHELQD